jgi:hypothetical protein
MLGRGRVVLKEELPESADEGIGKDFGRLSVVCWTCGLLCARR